VVHNFLSAASQQGPPSTDSSHLRTSMNAARLTPPLHPPSSTPTVCCGMIALQPMLWAAFVPHIRLLPTIVCHSSFGMVSGSLVRLM
jgi:hypothetical protein